jgi:signal transduction histidine kinase/ActR/RegA family two-component response regulator
MIDDEQLRLKALRSYGVLDTPPQETFDRVVMLAAKLFDVPIALVSLIDFDRQWFKAKTGLGATQTPREWAFCSHAIEMGAHATMVVEDTTRDPRFCNNPLVTGNPDIRFYAGAVLTDAEGHNLGTLCIIDTVARACPSSAALEQLRILANIVTDEMALHRANTTIEQKNSLLDLAESMSGVGHWRYEPDSQAITWSREVYRIHGVDPAAYAPTIETVMEFYPPEVRTIIAAHVADAIATGNGYNFQRQIVGRDGATREVACKAVCESNSAGAVTAIFGVFQDITEHVAALKHANAAAAVKAEFLANMSHELRTPLTSIIGFSELLRSQPGLDEKSRGYVDRVIGGGQALLATVNDVLDFSKLEAGQIEIKPQAVTIRDLFETTVALFEPQAAKNDVRVKLAMTHSVPETIIIDPDRLRQILLNLIGNAVKFTQAGTVTIAVNYNKSNEEIAFSVIDTGIGIQPEKIAHLFHRFSQVDNSSSRTHGGTGLGLAICKGLVEAMGGVISVESIFQKGTTFRVRIPCAGAEGVALVPKQQADAVDLRDLRILAVDDNAANRALLSAILKHSGAELTLANDGAEAIHAASIAPQDIILMDLHMPVIDGVAACEAIRTGNGPNAGVPILAFTAEADPAQQARLLAAGFDGVVCKPILPAALMKSIADALAPGLPEISNIGQIAHG